MQIPIALLATHFVADFILQTDWMALNKSKRFDALALHASVYALAFWTYVLLVLPFNAAVLFWTITLFTHGATDAVTSRATSRLWAANERHWFFVMIGFDQLIHFVTLAWTWNYVR